MSQFTYINLNKPPVIQPVIPKKTARLSNSERRLLRENPNAILSANKPIEQPKPVEPLERLCFLKNMKEVYPETRSLFNLRDYSASMDQAWIIAADPARPEQNVKQCTFIPIKSALLNKQSDATEFPILLTDKCVFTFENDKYITQHINSLISEFKACPILKKGTEDEYEIKDYSQYINITRNGNTVTISSVSDVKPEIGTHLLLLDFRPGHLGISFGLYFAMNIKQDKAYVHRPSFYKQRALHNYL